MPDSSNTDWGLKKEYLHSTRQHSWNNDYVDFISAGHADFESEQRRFITDHGLDEKYADSNSYLAARCHVISYGYKNEVEKHKDIIG